MVGLRARLVVALLAFAALAALPAAAAAGGHGKGGKHGKGGRLTHQAKPNIVAIVSDDQTLEQYRPDVMPITTKLLGDHGTTFSQSIVSIPQCCPSRAGYYTGQYAQNNGVFANRPGYGLLRDKRNVLPAWLDRAGYKTIHLGKFLNGYTARRGLHSAPGWDRWLTLVRYDFQNPTFSKNGTQIEPGEYLTDVLNEQAVSAVNRFSPRKRPFFLQVDQFAPHVGSGQETGPCAGGTIPSPADENSFTDARSPDNPATMELDVSDKPDFIGRRPIPFGPARTKINHRYGCALAALQDVDRGVGQLIHALHRNRELSKTLILFVSDNGYAYGEHRVQLDKGLPYEEHLRVPMVIRPPKSFPRRFRSGATIDAPVANIDLAPTFLHVAGTRPCIARRHCRRLDGHTLVPLLKGREPAWTRNRAIATSFDLNAPSHGRSCAWHGYRSPRQMVTLHTVLPDAEDMRCRPAHEYEVYNLRDDPWELENRKPPTKFQVRRLKELSHCSGIKGRDRKLKRRPFCE